MKKLWIYYKGEPGGLADEAVRSTLEACGGRWYGSGTNLISGERDSSFHISAEDAAGAMEKAKKQGWRCVLLD
jgi:hypothetical protein